MQTSDGAAKKAASATIGAGVGAPGESDAGGMLCLGTSTPTSGDGDRLSTGSFLATLAMTARRSSSSDIGLRRSVHCDETCPANPHLMQRGSFVHS